MIQSDDGDDLLMREKNRMYGADMGNVIALYILSFFLICGMISRLMKKWSIRQNDETEKIDDPVFLSGTPGGLRRDCMAAGKIKQPCGAENPICAGI